jgi:hydrogenase expression/formation protein HypE
MKLDAIKLGHGSGGKLSHDLIDQLFMQYFKNDLLLLQGDSAVLNIESQLLSFTTDSFVVDPLFFPGGDIGKIAVAGTVNDLAVSGAIPKYLSAAFIIEEGLNYDLLERVVISMANEAQKAGVMIVTGDTKVVAKGQCDKLFINTSGIGVMNEQNASISSGSNIKVGDKIIINGSIGDHGMSIMAARNELNLSANIESDCACLNAMIHKVLSNVSTVKFMRDATRGGLSTVLAELANKNLFGLEVSEEDVPVKEMVRGMCELLGFDPFYVANEGKLVLVVAPEDAQTVVELMQEFEEGKQSAIIGEITADHIGKGWIKTPFGGKRMIDMLSGEQLPRIC